MIKEFENLVIGVIGKNFENVLTLEIPQFKQSVQLLPKSDKPIKLSDPVANSTMAMGDFYQDAVIRFCLSFGSVRRLLVPENQERAKQYILLCGQLAKAALAEAVGSSPALNLTTYSIEAVRIMEDVNAIEIRFVAEN